MEQYGLKGAGSFFKRKSNWLAERERRVFREGHDHA